jgi:hypothetical protein
VVGPLEPTGPTADRLLPPLGRSRAARPPAGIWKAPIGYSGARGYGGRPTEVAPDWGLRRNDLPVHSAPWTSELRARPMDGGATRARAAVSFFGSRSPADPGLARGSGPRPRVLPFWARARSSAGERSPHTREVAGSIPAAPTIRTAGQRLAVSISTTSAPSACRKRAARTSSSRSASSTSSDGNRCPYRFNVVVIDA